MFRVVPATQVMSRILNSSLIPSIEPCRVALAMLLLFSFFVNSQNAKAQEKSFPLQAKRILFLGDSITHAGKYVALIEAQLKLQGLEPCPEMINLGLSSETCSGLTEPDHPFPRPDVHERIDRALAKLRPDLVVACYGMNDGIYYPFSEDRFAAYQKGIHEICRKVHESGAKVILMTPPPFDPVPIRGKLRPAGAEEYAYYAPFEGYDNVLKRYGAWILSGATKADMVLDLHGPVESLVAEKRKTDPKFTVVGDGVHPNAAGHEAMADAILTAWGIDSREPIPEKIKTLVFRKTSIVHDSYLLDVGHLRPGVKKGMPVEEMRKVVQELDEQIDKLVEEHREANVSKRDSTQGTIYTVHYPADLAEGQLKLFVDYYLWVPEDCSKIRGIIVHQHGCGPGASIGGQTAADDLHWQRLAAKWDCALLGSSYEPRKGVNCRAWCDPRNGSDQRFQQALSDFASATDHPDIAEVPWCLWGHSGGGYWASLMQTTHPEKIVAIWFRSGTAFRTWTSGETEAPEIPTAAYKIPMMANPGLKEKDHPRFKGAWIGLKSMQQAYLESGAEFFEFAADPNTGHECGGSRYLAIPFFDFWLEHRLPEMQGQPLRSTKQAVAAWEQQMQPLLEQYRESGVTSDRTPPEAPLSAKIEMNADGSALLIWQAKADFESGISGFNIEKDGKPLAPVPSSPLPHYVRPLFQGLSYHDTPVPNPPSMGYKIPAGKYDPKSKYSVRTINGVGEQSKSTQAQ